MTYTVQVWINNNRELSQDFSGADFGIEAMRFYVEEVARYNRPENAGRAIEIELIKQASPSAKLEDVAAWDNWSAAP